MSWCHRNIAFLEFYHIVLSLHRWGHTLKNQRVLFFTDNEALVHVIKKQTFWRKSDDEQIATVQPS